MRRLWLRALRAPFTLLRGFITVPGAISLLGVALALLAWRLEPEDAGRYDPDAARTVLSTLATAAMAALSLIYSSVLIVFTLAAGNIAPRLMERFSQDRINQIAVGALGALFLYAVAGLTVLEDNPSTFVVAGGAALGGLSVLLLLVFIDRVAARITIDQEIAEIAGEIDRHFGEAPETAAAGETIELGEDAHIVRAPKSGYFNALEGAALAEALKPLGARIAFAASPGDPLLAGDTLARFEGEDAEAIGEAALAHVSIGERRTQESDVRFSIDLLLEIALRALSPGVNDAFTAITCVDRLAASIARASEQGVRAGAYRDGDGELRVASPRHGLDDLIAHGFAPIRRASCDNLLVAGAALKALLSLRERVADEAREEADRQIDLLIEGIEGTSALRADVEPLLALAKGR